VPRPRSNSAGKDHIKVVGHNIAKIVPISHLDDSEEVLTSDRALIPQRPKEQKVDWIQSLMKDVMHTETTTHDAKQNEALQPQKDDSWSFEDKGFYLEDQAPDGQMKGAAVGQRDIESLIQEMGDRS